MANRFASKSEVSERGSLMELDMEMSDVGHKPPNWRPAANFRSAPLSRHAATPRQRKRWAMNGHWSQRSLHQHRRYASFVRQTKKRIYKCEDHEKNCNKRACDGPKERMIDQRCSPIECRHVRVKPLNNRLRAVMGRNRRTPVDDAVEACHVKPETAPRMNAGAIA